MSGKKKKMSICTDGLRPMKRPWPPPEEEVERASYWLKEFAKTRKTINRQYSSYVLKHCAERYYSERFPNQHYYVSNGAFLVAAERMGFEIVQLDEADVAGYMNISVPHPLTKRYREAKFIGW